MFQEAHHFCQESIWLIWLEHSDVSQKPVLLTLLQTLPHRLGVLLASRVLATGTLSAVKCNAMNSPLKFPIPMLKSFCSFFFFILQQHFISYLQTKEKVQKL